MKFSDVKVGMLVAIKGLSARKDGKDQVMEVTFIKHPYIYLDGGKSRIDDNDEMLFDMYEYNPDEQETN